MVPTRRTELTRSQVDAIAWAFLRSEFTGQIYAGWSIDRRIHAFLNRYGPSTLRDDGASCNALLECVMANIGQALRNGDFVSPTSGDGDAEYSR